MSVIGYYSDDVWDDVPLNELPCTYKIDFVEYKPTDKIYPTSVLRIPFMFFDEGQSVCIPAYGNQSVELSPLGFSVFVNAISKSTHLSTNKNPHCCGALA